MPFTVAEIARQMQGEVLGDGSIVLNSFAPASHARTGDLTFAENADYLALAEKSAASAVIVDNTVAASTKVLIRVKNPRVAFAKTMALFFPEPVFKAAIHPTAVIDPSAQVDATAHVGPHCVVGERVHIGARAVLLGGDHIGADSKIGADTKIFPNVTIYPGTEIGCRVRIHSGTVIGADGFGYVPDEGVHLKVPQIGHVIIGDDVELGANVTVDRGALGPTIIGKGSKVDNLVQIGHNVVLGEHCIIVSQVGIAGSTKLGDGVTLGGQVGVGGHLKIGNHVSVVAQSGVMHNIPDGERWMGAPAQPDRRTKRQMLALQQLPELIRRVNKLEKKSDGQ